MATKGKGVDLFAAENIVAIFVTKPNTNVTDAAVSVEINGATAGSYTLVSDDEGRAIRVRVSFAEDAGNHEELTSAATGTVEAAVVIPPLTATTHGVPSSHDGSAAFTFELRFREEPEPDFSYTTWRDPAFTVTGDQVTQARRLERPSNIRWEINRPSRLQRCGDRRAARDRGLRSRRGPICTEDGRRLSNRLEVMVDGP